MADVNFHSQLASIMEVLANAAVAEICQLVDDGYAVLRLEISRTQRENLALKSKLQLKEVRSRDRLPRRIPALPSREKAVKHSSCAKRTTGPMLLGDLGDLGSHPSGVGDQAILVKEEDLGDGDTQLNNVLPVVGNVPDEDEQSTLWQQECGSSVEDDDSRASAVTGLEEEEEEERPAQSADSGAATLEMMGSSSGLDSSPYLPAVIIKEEDGTQFQDYGECEVTSQAIQVSRQQDYEDAKEEPSGLSVTPQVEEWFTCHHCGLSYAKQAALKKHLMHTHTPARCKVCNEEFPNNKTLAAHLKISCAKKYQKMHKYETKGRSVVNRSFASCPTCSRSILITHLSRHMWMHAGDRPFRCQVCGKGYRYESSYETHQRSHVQEKYQCPDCGKAFKERAERDFHKCVVFKGEMEFSCSACGESFGRLSLLKRHRLAEHAGMHFEPQESKTYNQGTECCE